MLERIALSPPERDVPAMASSGSLSSVKSAEMSISSAMAKPIRCSASRYSCIERWRRSAISISPAAAESGVRISCATAAANDWRSVGTGAEVDGTSGTRAALRGDGVAHPSYRANQPRARPEFLSEIADVDVHHIRPRVLVAVPHVHGQVVTRDRVVGAAHQVLEQPELSVAQEDGSFVDRHVTRVLIQFDRPARQHAAEMAR